MHLRLEFDSSVGPTCFFSFQSVGCQVGLSVHGGVCCFGFTGREKDLLGGLENRVCKVGSDLFGWVCSIMFAWLGLLLWVYWVGFLKWDLLFWV